MNSPPIQRCVLYIGGYDPVPPERFFARQDRHLDRYRSTWAANVTATPPQASEDGRVWRRTLDTVGEDGAAHTDFRLLAWDDIVKRDFDKPHWKRLPLAIGVLADFVLSGTVYRYFVHAWRFALYFLAPYAATLLFIVIGAGLGDRVAASRLPFASLLAVIVAVAILALLLRWPGRRWYVAHLLDARTFMGQYLHGGRADMDARLDRFAHELIDAIRERPFDELVVIGHSQGSVFALECLERALSIDPAWPAHVPASAVLTVGSCVLQLGLHPKASRSFIPHLKRLQLEPSLDWLEFQALSDPVNFYKTDPASILGLPPGQMKTFPKVIIVKIRDMLKPETYARVKKSLFRLHYQFVTGNDRRYSYDFYRICCGPSRVRDRFMLAKPAANQESAKAP